MAEVLNIPRQPDGQSFYETSGLKRSSSSLFCGLESTSPDSYTPPAEHQERVSISLPSSATSSPLTSTFDFANSEVSTPASSDDLSILERTASPDEFQFPNYNYDAPVVAKEPADETTDPAPDLGEEPVESTTTSTTRSDSPVLTPTVSDDTALKQEPSHHVDYLSHDWREEDIWSSWRHIVSQRKVYGQRSRLENASWRTWTKAKYHLRTVSPETLNWLKESDVTWLYGPLKQAETRPLTQHASEPASQLSRGNSFINKKPILKKRSMSEVMLQKSISTSSLLKQAAASVEAQGWQPRQTALQRANSDFFASTAPSQPPSRDQIDDLTSRSSSSDRGLSCECAERRHIRFDDKVEQCIAVDCKEGEFEDEVESEEEDEKVDNSPSDSSSDDGLIIMKMKKRPGKSKGGTKGSRRSRSNSQNGRRMIETLPSANLKYRTDSPDVTEEAQPQHIFGRSWGASKLSPSPSQETIKPSRPSQNFLLGGDDEDDDAEEVDSSWSFGANNPKSSLGAATGVNSASSRGRDATSSSSRARTATPAPVDEDYTMEGMRRTESGMWMPVDDDDDEVAIGLFGRVSETINTARDIAHVIWNVSFHRGSAAP